MEEYASVRVHGYLDEHRAMAQGNDDTAKAAFRDLARTDPDDPLIGFHLKRLAVG